MLSGLAEDMSGAVRRFQTGVTHDRAAAARESAIRSAADAPVVTKTPEVSPPAVPEPPAAPEPDPTPEPEDEAPRFDPGRREDAW